MAPFSSCNKGLGIIIISPIIYLKAYKLLGLLQCIFNDIYCPEARKNSVTRPTLLAILFMFVETLPII